MPTLKPSQFLMIPGPTPVPTSVLEVLARPPIGHRSTEFSGVLSAVSKDLQALAQTKEDVFVLTGSATLAMEAAISNTLSPGDKVLCLVAGVFGERFAKIAEAYGTQVERLNFQPGTAVDIDQLADRLKADKEKSIKAVNENQDANRS